MQQSQIPHQQHLLSQVLLRPWTNPATGLLGWYSLEYSKSYARSPRAVGKQTDFLKVDALATERRWHLVENRVPDLVDAAVNGSGLLSPEHQDIARQVLALHWARGLTSHELEKRMVPLAVALTKRELLRDEHDKLAAAFYERFHLYPAGREALAYYVTRELDYSRGAADQSFADRVRDNYQQAYALLANFGIQVWRAPPGTELVCSDIGALTLDPARPLGGPLWGVPWFEAKTIFMPLGPSVVIAAGNPPRREMLPPALVDDLNQRMIWSSLAHVVHRQDPAMKAWIRDTWSRRPQLRGHDSERAAVAG